MPYRIISLPSMMIVRWEATATVAALDQLKGSIEARAAQGRAGAVFVIAPGSGPPDSEAREHLVEQQNQLLSRFAWSAMVIEGEGLGAEIKRTFAKAISLLTRNPMPLLGSMAEVARVAPAELVGDPTAFVEAYRKAIAAPRKTN